jgi:uncharacterized protein YdeI (YjbR/CyaY-like superfamily)
MAKNAPSQSPPNSTHPKTLLAWRRWLQKHHTRPEGVWLISYKKETGKARLDYAAAVEEALCFGWIDSTAHKLDAERSMLWMAPRKPRSGWSRVNKARLERLLAEGRMHPAGLAKIEAAKRDGSWTSLDAVEALEMPSDLQAALDANPPAHQHFDRFPPSAQKMLLGWVASARRPETRARRIAETVAQAAQGKRANEWRPKP